MYVRAEPHVRAAEAARDVLDSDLQYDDIIYYIT